MTPSFLNHFNKGYNDARNFGVKSPFRTHPAYLQGFAEGMRDRSPVPAENAAPVEAPSTDHSKDVCVLCGKDRSAHTGLGCPDYSVTEVKYTIAHSGLYGTPSEL
jgi:hypothetical protein